MSFYIQMIKCPLGPWPCAEGFIQFNSKSLSVPSLHKRKVSELLGIKLTDLSTQCNNQSQHYSVHILDTKSCLLQQLTRLTLTCIQKQCFLAKEILYFSYHVKPVTFQFHFISMNTPLLVQFDFSLEKAEFAVV